MRIPRPSIGTLPLSAILIAYVLGLLNMTFWRKGLEIFAGQELKLALLGAAFFTLALAIATALSFKYLFKPIAAFLVTTAAVSAYFVDGFGLVIDGDMIGNVVSTNLSEARHFITPDFMLHCLVYAVLPCTAIFWVRVTRPPFWTMLRRGGGVVTVCLVATLLLVGLNYRAYSSTIRERRDFLATQNPGAPIAGALHFVERAFRKADLPLTAIGLDAVKGPRLKRESKPALTVIVVGETARAQNFSLNGYARDTNPELSKRDVISFTEATSCGTATAVSLPCMFSMYTRGDYTGRKAKGTENLLDVLSHAGVTVTWWDNNTGSKGVADRVAYEHVADNDTRFCDGEECTDGILVERLRAALPTITRDTVIVMHQIGSHGPAYYLRYPKPFEKFTPVCRTAQFGDCTREQIAAAYDNSIAYTDHVLAQVIDMLDAEKRLATALIYVSDHGESLGENGLYLHGFPYVVAPDFQKKVPFIVWASKRFAGQMALDTACLRSERQEPVSHDNLFHSVLGIMDVGTSVYRSNLDIFDKCRRRPAVPPLAGKAPRRNLSHE
jgi:lipid A ethanolaminephosphotransferase